VFQDVCLYSEVSHRLGSATYRLTARRFLQELFLDLQFETVSDWLQTMGMKAHRNVCNRSIRKKITCTKLGVHHSFGSVGRAWSEVINLDQQKYFFGGEWVLDQE
jgi:hypothetical protein